MLRVDLELRPAEIVSAHCAPRFEAREDSLVHMLGMNVSGPIAYRHLKDAGVASADVETLTVDFEGLSATASDQLKRHGRVGGVTTGAIYTPAERHISVYAGNLTALCLEAGEPNIGQRATDRVDKTLRLALGCFVSGLGLHEERRGPQEILVSKSNGTYLRSYSNYPERGLRRAFGEDMWPVLAGLPPTYSALTLVALGVAAAAAPTEKARALRFEDRTRGVPVVRFSPLVRITNL